LRKGIIKVNEMAEWRMNLKLVSESSRKLLRKVIKLCARPQIKFINLLSGQVHEFKSQTGNEIEARKQVGDQALDFTMAGD
jgi:hypothetical protein